MEPQSLNELFHNVEDNSPLVRKILARVFSLATAEVRQAYIQQVRRLINRKALVLIEYAFDTLGATEAKPVSAANLKKIQKVTSTNLSLAWSGG